MTRLVLALLLLGLTWLPAAAQSAALPALDRPVNDLAGIIDADSARELDRVIRALQAASGDAIVVATVPTLAPYDDIDEYAVRLFENHGRGLGAQGKDNGLLVLVAPNERRVRIEVGYGLEGWITDGYAGALSRDVFTPYFREGRYGPGLVDGVTRLATRIAEARNVTLTGVAAPPALSTRRETPIPSLFFVVLLILALTWFNRRPPGGRRSWGNDGWSGWSSGVGPFGGGYYGGRGGFGGGGFGGGGFGGGFGGFGGGRSGGGGGGSSW